MVTGEDESRSKMKDAVNIKMQVDPEKKETYRKPSNL